jgi:hypothetical protein
MEETVYTVIGIGDFEKHRYLIEKDPGMEILRKDIEGKDKFIIYKLKENGDVCIIKYTEREKTTWETTAI